MDFISFANNREGKKKITRYEEKSLEESKVQELNSISELS